MNHIELFAGCGGLCLGLTEAGFNLLLANELSPMASETFAYNLLGENLSECSERRKTLWLSSKFSNENFESRLREDPRTYPDDGSNCELQPDGRNLEGSLVVGDIHKLNSWLESNRQATDYLRKRCVDGEVDLVSGGPPCQSFSLAGLREYENAKNSLPWEFVKFTGLIRPRTVLLENVTGILRPFTVNGQKIYAWFEVCKAFAGIDYIPLPLHVNAKFAGVPQSRPRFLMIGVRKDVFDLLLPKLTLRERGLFMKSAIFQSRVAKSENVKLEDLTVYDLNRQRKEDVEAFTDTFLSPLFIRPNRFVSVRDAIGDLAQTNPSPSSAYLRNLNAMFKGKTAFEHRSLENDRKIVSQPRVQRRFRIYQILSPLDSDIRREVLEILSRKRDSMSQEAWKALRNKSFLVGDSLKSVVFRTKADLVEYLLDHNTRKHSQRALIADEPAPAALTIPDDACHYSDLRTLSAREMARLQSFPDNFVFRSKATTGGQNRSFEVPVYTQIGNAVPVLLAYAIGKAIADLLERIR